MDIGTAKPSIEKRTAVPHHLIDVVEPSEEFNVARYVEAADRAIQEIISRSRNILVVGGTALYIKGLTEGLFDGPGENPEFRAKLKLRARDIGIPALHAELTRVDPESAARIHPNDYRRIERALEVFELTGQSISRLQTQWDSQQRYDCRFAGLRRAREDQNHRINARVKRMMQDGLLDEVRRLLAEEKTLSRQARQAVGYAELIDHLSGSIPLEDAVEKIKINSRRLAKQQRTWFRRFPDVTWFDLDPDDELESVVERVQKWYDSPP